MNVQQQQQIPFGTCKVKDGLYIGDEYAAKDIEFIVANKIGYIVNCSSDSIENLLESMGVMYFSFQWPEEQPGLVASKEFVDNVFEFIEESLMLGQSCLIVSQHGQSRACSLVSIYLMHKFKWTLYKTLEYLNSRRNDLEIKTTFFDVLNKIEKFYKPEILTKKWEIQQTTSQEEIIVINTYLNAKSQQIDIIYLQPSEFQKINNKNYQTVLGWNEIHVQVKHNPLSQFKSILKGSNLIFNRDSYKKNVLKSSSVNKENIPDSAGSRKNTPSLKSTSRSQSNPKQLQQSQNLNNQSFTQQQQPQLLHQYLEQSQLSKISSQKQQNNSQIQTNSKKNLNQQVIKKNTGNQVVYPVKILRPKMPNFENI